MQDKKSPQLPRIKQPLLNIISMLNDIAGMDLWMFTQVVEDQWIVVAASDNTYGVKSQQVYKWSDSVCSRMVLGQHPNIVEDISKISFYSEAPITNHFEIASYIGFPITNKWGDVVGSLCAIDKTNKHGSLNCHAQRIEKVFEIAHCLIHQSDNIYRLSKLVKRLDSTTYEDKITGLPNQEAFYEIANAVKQKYVHLDCPIAVLIVEVSHSTNPYSNNDQTIDNLMCSIAADLSTFIRQTDELATLSGGKFGILIVNVDTRYVGALVLKISQSLSKYDAKISIGANICREGDTIESSIEKAIAYKMI